MRLLTLVLCIAALAFYACANTNSDECSSDSDCDDEIDCTDDDCDNNECSNEPRNEFCAEGETCDPEVGCVSGGCTGDEDCDDGHDCTMDFCESGGNCAHRTVDELCDEGLTCDEEAGCIDAGCRGDEDCADGFECTLDFCEADGSCTYVPSDASCPEDQTCVEGLGCVEPCETDEDCDDGVFCNGAETCETEFGCRAPEEPEDCDDGEECTIDSCDAETDMCIYDINMEIPGCDEFDPSHLNGCFTITPNVQQRCAFGSVNYDFSEVCFETIGPVMTIQAGPYELVQDPAPTDANFNAFYEVTGGCTEQYRLVGTFSGSSTFSATWTSTFINVDGFDCTMGGCANRTIPVTATRISGP